eukprot:CFRG5496T1
MLLLRRVLPKYLTSTFVNRCRSSCTASAIRLSNVESVAVRRSSSTSQPSKLSTPPSVSQTGVPKPIHRDKKFSVDASEKALDDLDDFASEDFSSSATHVRLQGLVAGITYKDMNLSLEEAFFLLNYVPEHELLEVEEDLASQNNRVVLSTPSISVLDELNGAGHGIDLRSLHFNNRLDLVQTCVEVDAKTGEVDHSNPPPSFGKRATHLQGLALGYVLRHACALGSADGDDKKASTKCNIAVLGAGGCSLPSFLHHVLPDSNIVCVEASPDVVDAARDFFGVRKLEEKQDNRFTLIGSTAEEWVELIQTGMPLGEATHESLDLVIVDIEDGDNGDGFHTDMSSSYSLEAQLIAPPTSILNPKFWSNLSSVVAPGGVIAINVIGTEVAHEDMRNHLVAYLPSNWTLSSCTAPNIISGSATNVVHGILMACNGPRVTSDILLEAAGQLPRLVDDPEAWVDTWKSW